MWKKLISLFLILCFLTTLIGCGGVTPNIGDTNQSGIDLIKITDPESNIFIIAREDSGDIVAGLVEKNNLGNPTKITGAFYIDEQGNAFVIEPGIDGLPLRITDSLGNIIKYENYTNSTVDISIYDSNGNILQAPNTIYVDSEELSELKQLYNSINSKDKYDQDAALNILKWVGIGVNWVGCGISIYATVQTAGLLSATIVKACGSAIASTVIALTQNEIDDAVATGVGVGSCVVGGQIDSCVSLVLDIGEMVVEQIGDETEEEVYSINGEITNVSPLVIWWLPDTWYTTYVYVENTGDVGHTFKVKASEPSGTDFDINGKNIEIAPNFIDSVSFKYQFYGTFEPRFLEFKLYDSYGNLLDTYTSEELNPDAVPPDYPDSYYSI